MPILQVKRCITLLQLLIILTNISGQTAPQISQEMQVFMLLPAAVL